MLTLQNRQKHSNNSSASADEFLECVCRFVGLAPKGLKERPFIFNCIPKNEIRFFLKKNKTKQINKQKNKEKTKTKKTTKNKKQTK